MTMFQRVKQILLVGRGSQMRNVYQCVVLKRLPTEVYGEDSGAAATTVRTLHGGLWRGELGEEE